MSESQTSIVAALLERARGGDDAARDELFEKCRAYLGFLARSSMETWMNAKIDASDLIQQTMLDAHKGFANFRGQSEGEWVGWLKAILQHNALDFCRRYKGTEKRNAVREVRIAASISMSLFHGAPEPPGSDDSPSQILMQKENEILLADELARLPEDYQEVIYLRNMQRLPFKEIAERMGRSQGAVQMLWLRALKQLQEQMQHVE
jgi:RNA polymerase sigma-70 factor (ECF subfamily)